MKNKSYTYYLLAMTVFSMVLSLGCSRGKLTRAKAEELIVNQYKFPVPVKNILRLGEVEVNDHDKREYESWQREGVLEVQSKGKYTGERGMFDFYGATQILAVRLTPQGQKYVLKEDTDEYRKKAKDKDNVIVLLCRKELADISGIVGGQEKGDKHAVVYFTWRYGSFTPFGKYDKEEGFLGMGRVDLDPKRIFKADVNLSKFDDGWRIDPEEETNLPLE